MKLDTVKLKLVRKQKKLSAEKLSRKLGIHRTTYCAWEYGKRIPSENKIRVLANVLAISVNEISDLKPDKILSDKQYDKSIKSCVSIIQKDYLSDIDMIFQSLRKVQNNLINTKIIIEALKGTESSIFYVKDNKLKYMLANNGFKKLMSLNKNFVVLNKTDDDFFSIRESKANNDEDREVLRTAKLITREGYIPGSRRKKWGIISKQPVFDNDDNIEGVIGSFIDITKRKEAEKDREILHLNIDAITESILIWDLTSNKYIYSNKATENVIGYPVDVFDNRDGVDFWLNKCVHPDDRKQEAMYIQNKMWPENQTLKIIKSDGSIRWIERVISLMEIGSKRCRVTLTRDVTERIMSDNEKTYLYSANIKMARELIKCGKDIQDIIILSGLTKDEIIQK